MDLLTLGAILLFTLTLIRVPPLRFVQRKALFLQIVVVVFVYFWGTADARLIIGAMNLLLFLTVLASSKSRGGSFHWRLLFAKPVPWIHLLSGLALFNKAGVV